MKKKTDVKEPAIDVLEVTRGFAHVCIVGEPGPGSGLICNRLSEKAKHELLLPAPKKNAAERATLLKHKPYEEFRDSPYRLQEGDPTLIGILAASFKKAMMTAALDLPSTKKAQIGRLVWVNGHYTPIYGVPQIVMAAVRSADMNHTPDIRTRAILPRWACQLTIGFVQPLIKLNAVTRLLAAAGLFIGVGDWRSEKGSGTHGSFRLVNADDPEFLDIVQTGGRQAQLEAMKNPVPYDEETADLLAWFDEEIQRRQGRGVA
jgi:hypothetical protein